MKLEGTTCISHTRDKKQNEDEVDQMSVTHCIPDRNSSIEEKPKEAESVCFKPVITKSIFWDKKMEEQTVEWEKELEDVNVHWRQIKLHSIQVKLLRKIKEDMNNNKMFDDWLGDQRRKHPTRFLNNSLAVIKMGNLEEHFPVWDKRFADMDTKLKKIREESPDTDVDEKCIIFFTQIKYEMSDDETFNLWLEQIKEKYLLANQHILDEWPGWSLNNPKRIWDWAFIKDLMNKPYMAT